MKHADIGSWLLPSVLLLWSLNVVSGEDAQPIGYIRADVHAPSPLAPDATESITYRLTNISDSPVSLLIKDNSYQPLFVGVMTTAGKVDPLTQYDVWGPDTDETLIPNADAIQVSGVGRMGTQDWLPTWPERTGITLFKDEGYARIITFLAGWIEAKDIPKGTKDWLVVNAAPPLWVALPMLKPGAVAPNRPIEYDVPHRVMVPGNRLVPFRRTVSRPAKPEAPPAQEMDLRVSVEISQAVESGKDVVAIYLIGNHGTKPLWIWQNALVPALATWEVLKGEKVIATVDGSALTGMIDLLPERAPIPLNPGEYLSYQRVLLASALPLKGGTTYRFQVRVDAQWFATAPAEADKPLSKALVGSATIQVK